MSTNKQPNDFKSKAKIASISNVYPQSKTVDVRYLSQDGDYTNLTIPFSQVGLTWGVLSMPMLGDKVLLDMMEGDRPAIVRTFPMNTDYLPYLDPGEVALACENGSYIHVKNNRKKVQSTGALIDYFADTGPNGETDIELEPGGVIMQARSKQKQDGFIPRYDSHSFLALYPNGNINLQSMYQGMTKGLLYMDGTSGFVCLIAGNGTVQEYYELDPLRKRITEYSDGTKYQIVQTNKTQAVYGNVVENVCGIVQINVGTPQADIPVDFSTIVPDSALEQGDYEINATGQIILSSAQPPNEPKNIDEEEKDVNPSSTVYMLVDGVNSTIEHVSPNVSLGDLKTNLDPTNNAGYRFADANDLYTVVKRTVGDSLQQAAQAAISAGVTNATSWLTHLQAGLPTLSLTDLTSSVSSHTVPPGSSTVYMK